MSVLYLLTSFIDGVFIKTLFISILSIMLAGKVLKTDIRNAFVIVKILLLLYAILNIGNYAIGYFFPDTMNNLWERATGPYSFAFYLMAVPNTLLPLLLLFKKLGRNKYLLLSFSFLMNVGWLFEFIVVYNVSLHRDYFLVQPSLNPWWFFVLYGFFIGSIIYAVGRTIKHKMPNNDTSTH